MSQPYAWSSLFIYVKRVEYPLIYWPIWKMSYERGEADCSSVIYRERSPVRLLRSQEMRSQICLIE